MTNADTNVADYVIVGAGAAGPVLAARLSENPEVTVVLLEAGGENTDDRGRMQGAFFLLWGGEADWGYATTAQPELNGRQIYVPRGRVMGGSTAINVGAWLRGSQADYDGWAGLVGDKGWAFENALRVFRQIEDTDRGPSEWRGSGGPVGMADLPAPTALADTLLEGFTEAGYGPRGDVDAESPYVADRYQTIFPEGYRQTIADAYLGEDVRSRPNLTIITRAFARRVSFDGTRATGVVYRKDGRDHEVSATREVVLSAGAINTPQLLMLSGVGPAGHLREHGIDVVADAPGVGENLQDHLFAPVRGVARPGVEGSYPANTDEATLAEWRAGRTGPAAYWQQNGVGFVATTPGLPGPDFELMFQYNPDLGDGTLFSGEDIAGRSGYTIAAILLQPRSRGTVRLASTDPEEHPVIDPRYLSHPEDLATFVRGLRASHKITQSPSLAPYTEQVHPPVDASDEVYEKLVRDDATTAFHPVGTAKMGDSSDPFAVTDPQLRVRGVQGLRIADASVFPTIIRGHTMAPTVFVAERAAELLRTAQ
ncbi:GMC family oxidoreductase N-terminal domain-containing protein [Streptomyces sp. NPDC005811]|uniref:GMC family oxidoreductase n=1 Tax=Streptomyces sp. NPDC005811 TaxID=3154565 RepID=UPI0033CEB0DA